VSLSDDRYNHSAKGVACDKRYNHSAKGKVTRQRYEHSAKGKATKQRFNQYYYHKFKERFPNAQAHYLMEDLPGLKFIEAFQQGNYGGSKINTV